MRSWALELADAAARAANPPRELPHTTQGALEDPGL